MGSCTVGPFIKGSYEPSFPQVQEVFATVEPFDCSNRQGAHTGAGNLEASLFHMTFQVQGRGHGAVPNIWFSVFEELHGGEDGVGGTVGVGLFRQKPQRESSCLGENLGVPQREQALQIGVALQSQLRNILGIAVDTGSARRVSYRPFQHEIVQWLDAVPKQKLGDRALAVWLESDAASARLSAIQTTGSAALEHHGFVELVQRYVAKRNVSGRRDPKGLGEYLQSVDESLSTPFRHRYDTLGGTYCFPLYRTLERACKTAHTAEKISDKDYAGICQPTRKKATSRGAQQASGSRGPETEIKRAARAYCESALAVSNPWEEMPPLVDFASLDMAESTYTHCYTYKNHTQARWNHPAYVTPIEIGVNGVLNTGFLVRYAANHRGTVGYYNNRPVSPFHCHGVLKEGRALSLSMAFNAMGTQWRDAVNANLPALQGKERPAFLHIPGLTATATALETVVSPPVFMFPENESEVPYRVQAPVEVAEWSASLHESLEQMAHRYTMARVIEEYMVLRKKPNEYPRALHLVRSMMEGAKRVNASIQQYFSHYGRKGQLCGTMARAIRDVCTTAFRSNWFNHPDRVATEEDFKEVCQATEPVMHLGESKYEIQGLSTFLCKSMVRGKDPVESMIARSGFQDGTSLDQSRGDGSSSATPQSNVDVLIQRYEEWLGSSNVRGRDAYTGREPIQVRLCLQQYFRQYDSCMEERRNTVTCTGIASQTLAACVGSLP